MHRFPSGVIVLQLREMSVETTIDSTAEFVAAMGSCSAKDLADSLGITVVLAKERLVLAEDLYATYDLKKILSFLDLL